MMPKLGHSFARNIAVQVMLQDAFEKMSMISDKLELWIMVDLAPEVAIVLDSGDQKLLNLTLGSMARNHYCNLNVDHASITLKEKKFKVPYDAIYCLATKGSLAGDLNWSVEDGVAYVNLVKGMHGMQKPLEVTLF